MIFIIIATKIVIFYAKASHIIEVFYIQLIEGVSKWTFFVSIKTKLFNLSFNTKKHVQTSLTFPSYTLWHNYRFMNTYNFKSYLTLSPILLDYTIFVSYHVSDIIFSYSMHDLLKNKMRQIRVYAHTSHVVAYPAINL